MSVPAEPAPRGRRMKDLWIVLIFLGVYFALQLWILPKFGVST